MADININIALLKTSNNIVSKKNKAKLISKIHKDTYSTANKKNNKKNMPNKKQINLLDIKNLKTLYNPNSNNNNIVTCIETTYISNKSIPKRSKYFNY